MNQIFENKYLILNHDEEKSVFMYTWKSTSEDLEEKELLIEAQKILENVLKSKCQNIIGNDTDFKFPMSPDLQEELNNAILTNLNGGAIKKFAHVISTDFIAQLSAEQFHEENTKKTYEDEFFGTLEEAKKWIYNE